MTLDFQRPSEPEVAKVKSPPGVTSHLGKWRNLGSSGWIDSNLAANKPSSKNKGILIRLLLCPDDMRCRAGESKDKSTLFSDFPHNCDTLIKLNSP
jgi:hypothetical protein